MNDLMEMEKLKKLLPTGNSPVLLLSIATGFIVAFVIAGFEILTDDILLAEISSRPLWQIALAPGIGLLLAVSIIHFFGKNSGTGTSDEFIKAFHERKPRLPLRDLPVKLLAGAATIGFGGSLGLEGPSIYAGATTGITLSVRFKNWLRREDIQVLLTAGAAAGVAAVFKAPATGVLFALEAPYRDDVNRRALLPSLFAAATSYVTYINLVGTKPVIPFLNDPEYRLGIDLKSVQVGSGESMAWFDASKLADLFTGVETGDLFGALLLGVLAGLGGRSMAWLVRWSKAQSRKTSFVPRVIFGAFLLAALAISADAAFGSPLTIGPGIEAMEWVVSPENGLGLIALLFGLRIAATLVTLTAGGVGGLFIPLAAQGVILGQFTGQLIGSDRPGLYPTLGLAAFLGAGYRVPISAVMFVAESTAGTFVVPALIAAAVSQLVAGKSSVAEHQHSVRLGHLERRFTLPVTSALTTDVLTVPPDASISEFVYSHVLGRRELSVPVVDKEKYLGIISLSDISEVDRNDWGEMKIVDLIQTEIPAAMPSWSLRDAIAIMESKHTDILAVTDLAGSFIGILRADDILKLDEILEETGG